MKRLYLFFIGLVPAVLGYAIDGLVMAGVNVPLGLISLVVLIFCGVFGCRSYRWEKGRLCSLLFGNGAAILTFLLFFIQDAVLGQFSLGVLGRFPQMFFLPTLSAGARLLGWIGWLPVTLRMWMACLVSLALMLAAYGLGHEVGRRLEK